MLFILTHPLSQCLDIALVHSRLPNPQALRLNAPLLSLLKRFPQRLELLKVLVLNRCELSFYDIKLFLIL